LVEFNFDDRSTSFFLSF